MISLLLAGGISVAATTQTTVDWTDIDNHTLRGEAIPASQVVTRNRWGTPMLPDGTGGYSLIAKINPDFIRQSLIIPPRTNGMVAYRPLPQAVVEARSSAVTPVAPVINPVVPAAAAPSEAAPAPAEAAEAAPAEEAAPTF